MDIQTDANMYTEVFSWGGDHKGQLGLGIKFTGDQFYPFPKFCSYNISIKQVACGQSHACFITLNNYLYAMGSNSNGQLGIDDPVEYKNSPVLVEKIPTEKECLPSLVACGGNQSFLCCDDGNAYAWGEGRHGSLGLGTLQD